MGFIKKQNIDLLNIRLTSRGRELISKGQLTFDYYAIGDSEVDYDMSHSSFLLNDLKILQPVDNYPKQISFIKKDENDEDGYYEIETLTGETLHIYKSVDSTGFFTENGGNFQFNTATEYLKQADAKVILNEITGGTKLNIYQSSTYGANLNEPEIGDVILIKYSGVTFDVEKNNPVPYLLYRIDNIVSGTTLEDNNLEVIVDRELCDFSGSSFEGAVLVLYNLNDKTIEAIYNQISTDFISDSELGFLENCSTPIKFPFWNMTIINTDEIVGVKSTNKNIKKYDSKLFGGFVSYIQNQESYYNKLGVIHYSNQSPFNTYGEQLVYQLPTTTTTTTLAPTTTSTTSTTSTTLPTTTTTSTTETSGIPTLTTKDLTNIDGDISNTTAQSGGDIINDGGEEITNYGIIWIMTDESEYNLNISNYGGIDLYEGKPIDDVFTSYVSGSRTHAQVFLHVRSFAENINGIAYGEIKTHTFLTLITTTTTTV